MRFTDVQWYRVTPQNTLTDARNINFTFQRFSSPNVYIINDMTLMVKVKLTLNNEETKIPQDKNCSVVNNVLHSLFEKCKVYVENVLTSDSSENYPYKAYIIDTLSYNNDSKLSFLQAAGYYRDSAFQMGNTMLNSGFQSRKERFQTPTFLPTGDVTWDYSLEEACFVGRLHTDLSSSEGAILPSVEIRVVLERTSDDFVLLSETNENFQVHLKHASLYVPVGTLNAELFTQIKMKLLKEPSRIYYTRSQVTLLQIPSTSKHWPSPTLFSSLQLPSRLVLAFIPTENLRGSKLKNPFDFQRKWTTTTEAVGGGFFGIGANADPIERNPFVQKVGVTLNGKSLDGWETTATELEDTMSFYRMHNVMGFAKSREGNAISHLQYHNGYFFLCYDLSTSLNAGNALLVPSVRSGTLKVEVDFSEPLTIELQMVCYAEFPSLMTIDSHRRVRCSFVPSA